jgi:antitoxin component of RelBE/YafQ-DinJ toxin-antitoxin module
MPERDRVLTLRLSGAEHRRFKAVAEDMGLDVSAMLRALVREREKLGVSNRPNREKRRAR